MSLPTAEYFPIEDQKTSIITLEDCFGNKTQITTFQTVLDGSDHTVECLKVSESNMVFRTFLYRSVIQAYVLQADALRSKLSLSGYISARDLGAHYAKFELRYAKLYQPVEISFFFTNRKGEIVDFTDHVITGLDVFGKVNHRTKYR